LLGSRNFPANYGFAPSWTRAILGCTQILYTIGIFSYLDLLRVQP